MLYQLTLIHHPSSHLKSLSKYNLSSKSKGCNRYLVIVYNSFDSYYTNFNPKFKINEKEKEK